MSSRIGVVSRQARKASCRARVEHPAASTHNTEVAGKNHFLVLHQNSSVGVPAEKKKTVHDGDFDLNFKTEGKFWIYRPIATEKKDKK